MHDDIHDLKIRLNLVGRSNKPINDEDAYYMRGLLEAIISKSNGELD